MAERPPLVIVQGTGVVVQDVPSADLLKVNQVVITPEGGIAVRLKNDTGSTLHKGRVVKADSANDDSVVLCSVGDLDPIGIVYEDITAGNLGWIVVSGIAEVYVDNAGTVNREDWLGVSLVTAGQCRAGVIPSPPTDTNHFREVGHTIQGRTGAGLVRAVIHFN